MSRVVVVVVAAAALALLAAASPARAQDAGPARPTSVSPGFALSARVDPDPVGFAEPFDLTVEVTRGRGERLVLPNDVPDTKGARRAGPIRRDVVDLPSSGPGEAPRVKEIVRVPFLALDVEDVLTPELVIQAPDGSSLAVPALPVRVKGDATAPPKDDDKELQLAPAQASMFYRVLDARPIVALGALISSALAWAALARLRKRRFAAPPAPAVVVAPRAADEIALERLSALLASGLLQRGEVATFVARLMDEVLRDYLEARFALRAGTRTTRELVEELLSRAAPGLNVADVRALLEGADLVKFARAELAVDAAHQMANRVRAIVVATALRAPASGSEQSERRRGAERSASTAARGGPT